uniref:Uncharacterized protein n=1 Tax=Globisporangium ultimum (strain ATCC 200006 / CBS 805.95 / DAOM BR144) TaxID=431595 RepID=K3W5M5_GLOUD
MDGYSDEYYGSASIECDNAGCATPLEADSTQGQDSEYATEYWRLDAEAYICFADLCPEGQGESAALGDLGKLCRRMGRALRDESEQFRLMNELDTTNSMQILRHDFVAWLLQDMSMERDLTNARIYVREERVIPVAEPIWEECIVDMVADQPASIGSDVNASKYFYNIVTGESKWELPSLVQCLWNYIIAQEAKRSATSTIADPIQSLLTEAGNMEMLQDLRVLFTKYDDDGSRALDGTEFEDMCVVIGQPLPNGSDSARTLMREVDPFSAQEVVSWDAFSYYWVSNAPFQRRAQLDSTTSNSLKSSGAAWERIDVLHKKNLPVTFRNTQTQVERWNHPDMEHDVVNLLLKLFPSTKMDWSKKIALFFDVQCQNSSDAATAAAGGNHDDDQQQCGEVPSQRSWDLGQCARVLVQLEHPMARKKHVESAIHQIQSRFGAGDGGSISGDSMRSMLDTVALDEATVTAWFLYSIRKVEMNGWEEVVEPNSGQVYYYHELSGAMQWDPPQLDSKMSSFLSKFGGGSSHTATLSNDERITRMFRHYDLDESGSISFDEFHKLYYALLQSPSSGISTNTGELQVKQLFRVLDTGGDGSVSLDEFKSWWRTKLQLEEEETEGEKITKRIAQRRELCHSFLENADALILRAGPSPPLLEKVGGEEDDNHDQKQQQVYFESNLLPRLVAVLGRYQLKGLTYRNALKQLVHGDDVSSQEVELKAFLIWYDAFEASEREKDEIEAAKAKAQAELQAQEAKARAKAKEQQRKAMGKYKLQEQTQNDQDARRKRAETLFQAFDINGSGFLDEKELQQLTKALGHPMDDVQVHQMLQVMDTSGDRQVSVDEFWTFWSTFQRSDMSPSPKKQPSRSSVTMTTATPDKKLLSKRGKDKQPSALEVNASLSVGLEMAKTRMLKFSLDDFKEALGDWKDELTDKRNDRKKKQQQASDEKLVQKKRSVFIPTCKRRYAHLDVTWIEPEVVECVINLIHEITVSTRPLMRSDAAQAIQKIAKGYVTRSLVHKMIETQFRPHVDLHTLFYYYEDLESGHVLLDRPLYRTKTSTRPPFDFENCDTKLEKYEFQKKQHEMRAKKRFYEANGFVHSHPLNLKGAAVRQKQSPPSLMLVSAAMYLWDIAQSVHKRLLGDIWTPLRQRQHILTELIARRYRRQLQQRSSQGAAYLPLHYVVRHTDFPVRVVAAISQGYSAALHETDAFGMTPLHLAFRERRSSIDLFRILIGNKPGKDSRAKFTASKTIWEMKTRCGDTPLHAAVVHYASIELLRWILGSDLISIDVACMLNHHGESPFHVSIHRFDACSAYSKSVIYVFLKYLDASRLCSFRTKYGDLPLHLAMDAFEKLKQTKAHTSSESGAEAQTRQQGWEWLARHLMLQFPEVLLVRKASNNLLPIHLAIKYEFSSKFVHEMWISTVTLAEKTESSSILESTTIAETRMTLLHYAILHQPNAFELIQSIIAKMPEACSMQCLPNNDLPLHFAAGAIPAATSSAPESTDRRLQLLQLLCDHYIAGCQVYNKQAKLPLHLAIMSGQPAENVQLLIKSSPFVLSSSPQERNGMRALILAASAKNPDYHVLATLLELTPSVKLTVGDVNKRPMTPLYAISMRPCNQGSDKREGASRHEVLRKFSTKFEQIDDEHAYFLEMAKTKLRKRHFSPTSDWEFKKILRLMEMNPLDEAVLQRSFLAINTKIQKMIDTQAKKESDSNQLETVGRIRHPNDVIVDMITLNPELLIVRQIHQVMFEVPSNTRLQVLGHGILNKLLPTAFAKAAYKAKIDPYFDL